MRQWVSLLFSLLLAVFPVLSLNAQNPSSPAPQGEQRIRISSSEVVLDVVAKDKKGKTVGDLIPEDFEVYEDGVKQSIESFKLVKRTVAAARPEAAPAPVAAATEAKPLLTPVERKPDPDIGVSVVALVYDRLSQDGRKRAMDSSLEYLSANKELTNYVGVFAINLSLSPVQNYTTDLDLVKKGIEKAGALVSASFDSSTMRTGMAESEAFREAITGQSATTAQAAGAAGNSAAAMAAGGAAGAASVDIQFAAMQERTRETFETLQRDQQGFATTNSLMAIVNSMRRLPGRKAVIFFSEGVSIPPNVVQHFRSVINAANRANVSIYTVDAAGLRAESPLQGTRDEINARARRRMENLDKAFRDTTGPLTKGLERNEDLLNLNPQNALMQLALETGGTFIGDVNRIGPKLQEIDEELQTYYLMTYIPTNDNYDGKFRSIAVKTKRSGFDLQSRRGYYAVAPIGSSPLFYYEALPLAALNRPSPPREFPVLVHSLNFPESTKLGLTAVEVEVPASAFTFAADNERKVYTTDFSIVVLIKDQQKQVVDKLSYHYALLGPVGSIEAARKGKILFYRETNLPPGKYDVEAVAFDALSNKASVKKSVLEIPPMQENGLRLSSVTIVSRVEQLKEKIESPFRVGEVMLYPNLGEPIKKAVSKQMGFYFNVYPAKGEQPNLVLEVLQGAKSIARVPLKLTPPDEHGRIQFASALPLESLAPGQYELRITVSDSKGKLSRAASFTLEP